ARRALSFVPVAGWGFAFSDAYAGTQDVFRGQIARGLSGVGLAIGDVASDFLHLGGAVSGVGGPALGLAAQRRAIAGQIAREDGRYEQRLGELGDEIRQTGALPSDERLREVYELDDEDIAELKAEFAEPVESPDDMILADPPPWPPPHEVFLPPPSFELLPSCPEPAPVPRHEPHAPDKTRRHDPPSPKPPASKTGPRPEPGRPPGWPGNVPIC